MGVGIVWEFIVLIFVGLFECFWIGLLLSLFVWFVCEILLVWFECEFGFCGKMDFVK